MGIAWPRGRARSSLSAIATGARFDGLVFLDEGDPPRYVITQAHNHYGFRSTEFSYDDGTLNARLVSSLLTLNILRGTRENAIRRSAASVPRATRSAGNSACGCGRAIATNCW